MEIRTKLLLTALSQIGIREVKGSTHNPEVLKYFQQIGFLGIRNDETAWCAAFANWVLHKNRIPHTGKLTARSFLNAGQETKEPKPGDIVVFWRESKSSWKGHVGFFIRQDDRYIYTLGGNQNNQVCIKRYHRSRLLEFRTLEKFA